jgi:uncharacterized protein (TIGR03086 family)
LKVVASLVTGLRLLAGLGLIRVCSEPPHDTSVRPEDPGTVPAMTSASDLLKTASDDFRDVVGLIGAEQWGLATPCPDWSVLEVVGHVVGGSRMAAALVGGASRNEAIGLLATDFLGDDPLGSVDAALVAQQDALSLPGVEEIICHHPAGDMPAAQLLGFRLGDLLVHRWDLARAIGADEHLAADVVQRVWDDTAPMAPIIAQLGVFGDGPSGTVSEEAPLHERLLDLMGRRITR